VRLFVFLADAAQADPAGKVNALGLGWQTCASPAPAFALVIFLDVDWDETNTEHQLTCELLTADGHPVAVEGPFGPQQISFQAVAEVGRPPGTAHGTSLRVPLALSVAQGLQLNPGRYQWRVSVQRYEHVAAVESFTVVGPPRGTPGSPPSST
jgi:hypothetical protein